MRIGFKSSNRTRSLVGLALGIALAAGGPFGLAVGLYSHPVGVYSHPKPARGSISGIVSDQDGFPARCLYVSAYDERARRIRSVYTDWETGAYRLRDIPPGAYRLLLEDCEHYWNGTDRVFRTEWYRDKSSFGSADSVTVDAGLETLGIDAVVERFPGPDFAVTRLSVKKLGFATDYSPTVPGGWTFRVTVGIENLGVRSGDSYLAVWADAATYGDSYIGGEILHIKAGEALVRTYDWNALGTVGDVTVHACVSGGDVDPANNHRTARTFVAAGGTGVGVIADQSNYWECYPYF